MSADSAGSTTKSKEDVGSINIAMKSSLIDQNNNRIFPGVCRNLNRDSLSFGSKGFLAVGCNNLVVIIEVKTGQIAQTLNKHKQCVIRTAWSVVDEPNLVVASADVGGFINVWDVETGILMQQLHGENNSVTDLKWLDNRIMDTGHMLLSMHQSSNLMLWDTRSGSRIWKYSLNEFSPGSIDLDPFSPNRLLIPTSASFIIIEDFSTQKQPMKEPREFSVVNLTRHSTPGKSASKDSIAAVLGTEDKQAEKSVKLSNMMKQMVLGDNRTSMIQTDDQLCNFLFTAVFHKCMRDVVIISFSSEISLIDTKVNQVICSIKMDRMHTPVVNLYSCAKLDAFYVLHESGSISKWNRKAALSLSQEGQNKDPGSVGSSKVDMMASDHFQELAYESKVQSEHVRLGKNNQLLGMAVNPLYEEQFAFFLTDGRVYCSEYEEFTQIKQDTSFTEEKVSVKSVVGHHLWNNSIIKMCPVLTSKNEETYRPILAVGTNTGKISVYNTDTGSIEREVCVHSGPVVDLDWTSDNPAVSIISCCHITGSGSNVVKNELIHTNILTGKTRHLREDHEEESKITMIRVSSSIQYIVIAFASSPFELWDARNLCILKTMPKKFPNICALTWSPSHKLKNSDSVTPERKSDMRGPTVKEHILFSDYDSQLFHFSVEGHTMRDGTRLPAETALGHINTLSCKSELIVRGDSEGNINIWNVKARQSKNIHTGCGNIRSLKFSPGGGKSNLKCLILHNDSLSIWDLANLEIWSKLKSSESIQEIQSVDWVTSTQLVALCSDGSILLMGLDLAPATSSAMSVNINKNIRNPALLPSKISSKLHFGLVNGKFEDGEITELKCEENETVDELIEDAKEDQVLDYVGRNLKYACLFGLDFEYKFWSLLNFKDKSKLSGGYDIFSSKEIFFQRELDKVKVYLNVDNLDQKTRSFATCKLLCLGEQEPAIKLLLNTEPEDTTYLSDQLLACLISTISLSVDSSHLSTTKLVATKLIAEGNIWDGVQLLCLVGKVLDACTYLRASKRWDDTMWLAKTRLEQKEYLEICRRYSDYLISQGRYEECGMLHASNSNWDECLKILHKGQFRSLTSRLLKYIGSSKIDPAVYQTICDQEKAHTIEASS